MLSNLTICLLLLTVLIAGTTAQQVALCADSYAEFEKASVGSNVSGDNLRSQLFRTFYAPNHHLPISVLVTYQLVLPNGTRFNLSSDQGCSTELWEWLSSPVFLIPFGGTAYLNLFLFCTLNYFMEWDPPHVTITTTLPPCPDRMSDFLSQMTASLKDYALGQMESKTNLGYVKRGCGLSTFDTQFIPVGKMYNSLTQQVFSKLGDFGVFSQFVFVWMASAVLLKMTFKAYAQKTFTYSYDVYGMFWGLSTTAFFLLVIMYGFYTAIVITLFTNIKHISSQIMMYVVLSIMLIIPVAELSVAIYAARKATVAVPCIFRCPAILLCCGRTELADRLITTIVLWVDLVVLQMLLFFGIVVHGMAQLAAAPFRAIASNVMILVLALSCLTNIFSLLFTILAHFFTPPDQRKSSSASALVFRAVVVLPLLLMIMCYGAFFVYMGSVINTDTNNRNNPLSFIDSIIPPIVLGVISIFLKRIISAWLKWSPQNTEVQHGTNTFHTPEDDDNFGQRSNTSQTQAQEDDQELLDP